MTLVQLRHLISLVQTGSFSRSASAPFLTQPALSRSIRALELELGQPLFDLIGRRSELTEAYETRGTFLCRPGNPLAHNGGGVSFEQLRAYPTASTPSSDEVARVLVERYGPDAHPAHCVTLRCEEIPSLVELTRNSDAVLIAIRAAGPDLVELTMSPALNATARFAMVTLAGRSEAPALPIVRRLMRELLRDA